MTSYAYRAYTDRKRLNFSVSVAEWQQAGQMLGGTVQDPAVHRIRHNVGRPIGQSLRQETARLVLLSALKKL